jgi:glutathione synthase/RimK-type ligase-like ATP-grasp enzyme
MRVFLALFQGMKVDSDSSILIKALEKRGISGESVSWDDPSVDWGEPDLCIIKSTSNYITKPAQFIEWAKEVAGKTRLWNSCKLVEWNHDKHYLLDLDRKGVPIPRSIFVEKDSDQSLSSVLNQRNFGEFVIKPMITAGSFGLRRFKACTNDAESYFGQLKKEGFTQEFMDDLYPLQPSDAIVQEYVPEIVNGEVSLLYFGGEFSHAVIKRAKPGDFRSHPIWGATVEKYLPSNDELRVGENVLDAMDVTEYARIDLVDAKNGPFVIEVELIEPFLFFDLFPETSETFADHIMNSIKL